MGKRSAPVSIDDAILDQSSRYGLSTDQYMYGSDNSYTSGFELPDSFQKGNPFFTQTNQPVMAKTQSTSAKRPFLWSGNNKSLRRVYNDSYNAYWDSYAKPVNSAQEATWQGPQIRPEYQQGQSNGLSQLGTPSYWQDNNQNQVYDTETDDSFGAPQIDDMSAPPVGASSSGGLDDFDPDIENMIGRLYG